MQSVQKSNGEIRIAGSFTSSLWQAVEPIYGELLCHPFAGGLKAGTLPPGAFRHYLAQDILYLKEDARAMLQVSKRLKNGEHSACFKAMFQGMIELERVFDEELLNAFKTKRAGKKSKTISQYGKFLIKSSHRASLPCALCALLPCFWLYSAVGLEIYEGAERDNPYAPWIDFYNDEEMIKYVNVFIQIVEDIAQGASKKEKKQMKKYFLQASQYELAFFNEAIKMGKKTFVHRDFPLK